MSMDIRNPFALHHRTLRRDIRGFSNDRPADVWGRNGVIMPCTICTTDEPEMSNITAIEGKLTVFSILSSF